MKKFDKKKQTNKWDKWEKTSKKKHKPREANQRNKFSIMIEEPIFDDENTY